MGGQPAIRPAGRLSAECRVAFDSAVLLDVGTGPLTSR